MLRKIYDHRMEKKLCTTDRERERGRGEKEKEAKKCVKEKE